jgi:hypothetical protein
MSMPLSDREQQILSEIEAQLSQDDPRLARTVRTTTVSSRARWRIKLSIAGFVLGFFMLILYIPTSGSLPVGIAAFVLMLGSVVVGGDQLKRLGADQTGDLGGQLRGGFNRYLGDRRGRNDETQR